MQEFPNLVITHAAITAAHHGQAHILMWLHTQPLVVWSPDVIIYAAIDGRVSTLYWIETHFDLLSSIYPETIVHLASRNPLATKYLWASYVQNGGYPEILNAAASEVPLPLAQWMTQRTFSPITINLDAAARRGDLPYLKWAQQYPVTATARAMDGAAAEGHLKVVQWLHNNHYECTTDAIDNASANGHLSVILWLHRHRTEGFTHNAVEGAATKDGFTSSSGFSPSSKTSHIPSRCST